VRVLPLVGHSEAGGCGDAAARQVPRRSAKQRPAPTAPVCPTGGRSAAATHFVASAPRPPPALGPTIPKIAPTTSTADQPVSAEAMEPPIETSVVFGQLPMVRRISCCASVGQSISTGSRPVPAVASGLAPCSPGSAAAGGGGRLGTRATAARRALLAAPAGCRPARGRPRQVTSATRRGSSRGHP
jgi:hypothetical protein